MANSAYHSIDLGNIVQYGACEKAFLDVTEIIDIYATGSPAGE